MSLLSPSSIWNKIQPYLGSRVDPVVEARWWPLDQRKYSVKKLQNLSEAALTKEFRNDPLYDNLLLNKYEFANGISVLKSFPWRFHIPFTGCNGKCPFCISSVTKRDPISLEDLQYFRHLLPYAWEISLAGGGEPLIHPQFWEILQMLKSFADPRAKIGLTTNGSHLIKWADSLIGAGVTEYGVSLHAASSFTHNKMTGLKPGTFEEINAAIKYILEKRKENRRLWLSVNFVVTSLNIQELPDFIDYYNELGVDQILLRDLVSPDRLVPGLEYHTLPPYLYPDFEQIRKEAIKAIRRARVQVIAFPDRWGVPKFPEWIEKNLRTIPCKSAESRKTEADQEYLSLKNESRRAIAVGQNKGPVGDNIQSPDMHKKESSNPEAPYNPYYRSAPYYCHSPYTAFTNNEFHFVVPCGYIKKIPGFSRIFMKDVGDFQKVWNSPAMAELRRSLHQGPLMAPCMKCPWYC